MKKLPLKQHQKRKDVQKGVTKKIRSKKIDHQQHTNRDNLK